MRSFPKLRRPLTEAEAVAFREDLRAADQEIQNYFRLYYIIGLVGVAAWLLSPEAKPITSMVLGNGGYNIYVPLAIAALNVVSMTYLLYKSIEIQEIAQFIGFASKPDSGFLSWEEWRRSKASASRVPRLIYHPFLIIVPLALSFALLYPSCRVLRKSPRDLEIATSTIFTPDQSQHIANVFWWAEWVVIGVVVLHLLPAIMIYFNIFEVPRVWKKIMSRG
jgi:hypothetical protein